MVRVGIPLALLYYQYYPIWRTFFEVLGAEIMVSPPTTQMTLADGSARVVTDTCLPVKVFCGHVVSLIGECDCVFVPAIRSVKRKAYNCSKFLGLPDMTRAVVPEAPPVLDIDIDVNRGRAHLYGNIYRLGRRFNWNPLRVRRAAQEAWQTHKDYWGLMSRQGLTPPQAIEQLAGIASGNNGCSGSGEGLTVAVIGHSYMLYDELINHRLIYCLQQAGCRVLTPEMVAKETLERATMRLLGKAPWTYGDEVAGAGGHYLESGVDGVIGLMAFGCGPDSLMMDMVRRQAVRLGKIPFMCLTLEEHTAEAGIVTRLEAFLDMIKRRRGEVGICA